MILTIDTYGDNVYSLFVLVGVLRRAPVFMATSIGSFSAFSSVSSSEISACDCDAMQGTKTAAALCWSGYPLNNSRAILNR